MHRTGFALARSFVIGAVAAALLLGGSAAANAWPEKREQALPAVVSSMDTPTTTSTCAPTSTHTPTSTYALTPTETAASMDTPTPTPTSIRPPPGAPILVSPESGALLPQPVPPNAWVFEWSDGGGPPADFRVWIAGPGGRFMEASRNLWEPRVYTYTAHEYIPANALEPWYWRVDACGTGGTSPSETRTFRVMPAPGWRIHLPLLLRNLH